MREKHFFTANFPTFVFILIPYTLTFSLMRFFLVFFSIALYLILTACNNTTGDPTIPTPTKVCDIASLKYGQSNWTIEYNSDGEMSKLSNRYFISNYSYKADSIIEYVYNKSTGIYIDTIYYKLNADGNVVARKYGYSFTYDNNGYRKTVTNNNTTETYQVINGNYVSSVVTDDLTGNILTTNTFEYYTDQENKGTNWFDANPIGLIQDASFLMKHFGKQSKNMIKKISKPSEYIRNFTNEYNSDGYVSKQTSTDTTGTVTGIFDYTYICN